MEALRDGKTIAEAWPDDTAAPSAPMTPVARAIAADEQGGATAGGGQSQPTQAPLDQAFNTVMSDLAWLFDAMRRPQADTALVTQAVTARMATDHVGAAPPLPDALARAQQAGCTVALYVENLAVTIGRGKISGASVDRVALTTVHPSLRDRVADRSTPLVLDVSNALQLAPGDAMGSTPVQVGITPASPEGGQGMDAPRHAVLIVRHVANIPAEDSITVKLDALFPMA